MPVNTKVNRLYVHPLDPQSEKCMMAFAAKEIKFQKVYMNMENPAKWFTDYNGGMLPILETPEGQLISEAS